MYSTIDLKNLFVAPNVLFRYWGLVIMKLILLESVLPFQWIPQEKLIFHKLGKQIQCSTIEANILYLLQCSNRIVFIRNPLHVDSESLSKDIVSVLFDEYECFTAELADTHWDLLIRTVYQCLSQARSSDVSGHARSIPQEKERIAWNYSWCSAEWRRRDPKNKCIPKTTTTFAITEWLLAALRLWRKLRVHLTFLELTYIIFTIQLVLFPKFFNDSSWCNSNALENQEAISTEQPPTLVQRRSLIVWLFVIVFVIDCDWFAFICYCLRL